MINKVLILTGATASGKSKLSEEIALKYNSEIVNCDSKQIYDQLSIITSQPSESPIPYHLYGHINLQINYSVYKWLEEVDNAISDIHKKNKLAILVGGSGLYIQCFLNGISSIPKINNITKEDIHEKLKNLNTNEMHKLLEELDTESAKNISPNDRYRLTKNLEVLLATNQSIKTFKNTERNHNYKIHKYIINVDRESLYSTINQRFINMIQEGAIDEAKELFPIYDNLPYSSRKIIGLQEIILYLKNEITKDRMIELGQQNTRRYAKRQMTWFRNQFSDFKTITSVDQILQDINS